MPLSRRRLGDHILVIIVHCVLTKIRKPMCYFSAFKHSYDQVMIQHAANGVISKPLSAADTTREVELLKNLPKGEEQFILDPLVHPPRS